MIFVFQALHHVTPHDAILRLVLDLLAVHDVDVVLPRHRVESVAQTFHLIFGRHTFAVVGHTLVTPPFGPEVLNVFILAVTKLWTFHINASTSHRAKLVVVVP